jgi:hypothetical protein
MAANRYDRYFMTGPQPHFPPIPANVIAYLDQQFMPGSYYYFIHWVMHTPTGPTITPEPKIISHGPHIHQDAEILIHVGTDPHNPWDLGGEVELCMGPELEKHTFNQTTTVFIPPNFIHCPWTITKVTRPFLFITIDQGPLHTEKSYMQLVDSKARQNMIFIDEGFGLEKPVFHSPFRKPE